MYKSTRSEKLQVWIREETGIDPTVPAVQLLVDLERFARLCVHAYNLTGEVRPQDIHGLARAVKALQEQYENTGK